MKNIDRFKLLLSIGLLVVLSFGCKDSESSAGPHDIQTRDKAVPVAVVTVQPTPISDIVLLPGETEAWQDVRLAADTSGRVEWIGPLEGDTVIKDDLLAKIDVSALKASLDRAEAAFKLADNLFQRRLRLSKQGIVTQEELDRSKTERTLALMDLKQIRVRYNHGFVRAPISGIINRNFVDMGEYIETGKPMFDIVNNDKIKINVKVPELDVRYLSKGQVTQVRIDALTGLQMTGSIDFIAYKADPATKTFLTRTVIDNPGHAIRPGMIARVAFVRQIIPAAIAVPLFTVIDRGGERILFVEKDGIVHSRTISIGVIEKERVQITSGLEIGDHLIVKGHTEVEEGMRVVAQ